MVSCRSTPTCSLWGASVKASLPSAREYNWATPVPGGYKYGNLALQVGGVSDETVKYGREFWGNSAQEWLLWQGPDAIVQ
jgi:hypothetical protein